MARPPSDADPKKTRPTKAFEPGQTHDATANSDGQEDPVSYEVGYRRPPFETRFKPGQSGNSKGRKKHSRNLRTVMTQIFDAPVEIRDGDRLRRMTTIEALARTTLSRAFKDPKAMTALLVLMRHCGYGTEPDGPASQPLSGAELEEIISDYIDRQAPPENQRPLETFNATTAPRIKKSDSRSPKNRASSDE